MQTNVGVFIASRAGKATTDLTVMARLRPGHLPWMPSSVLALSGVEMISRDGVGDDENFPHDGDEGDFAGTMVGFDETAVEVAHRGGMADGGARGVEKAAHR